MDMAMTETEPACIGIQAPRFDPQPMLCAIQGDMAQFSRLTALFRRSVDSQLAQLHDALRGKNGERAAQIAHALKGSLAIFRALPAIDLLDELEMYAEAEDVCSAAGVGERVAAELDIVRDELTRFCARAGLASS